MKNVGKRIYYDNQTGDIILDIPEKIYLNDREPQTVERDIAIFKVLSERNRNTFDVLELPFGKYEKDFVECNEYRVNVETLDLEFSYPDPNNPDVEQPFQTPLSEEIKEIKNSMLNASDYYNLLDKESINIDELKAARILKLKEECTAAIHEGFTSTSTEHIFGYNDTDQSNFTKRMVTIVMGAPGPFKWKSKDSGVVELTKEQFIGVIMEAEAHQLKYQTRYWSLEAEIKNATTKEVVNNVLWYIN